MSEERPPDYNVKVTPREHRQHSGNHGKIGSAWLNEKGHITIVLQPCVVLSADDNLMIVLFPKDFK